MNFKKMREEKIDQMKTKEEWSEEKKDTGIEKWEDS